MISAVTLENWDRCRRLGMWSQDWEPIRITPIGAVYAALGRALECRLPDYTGPAMVRDMAMAMASDRGVDTARQDPYDLMVHYGHMAEVIARTIRQPNAEPLQRYGQHPKGYQVDSYLIDGGTRLLRYVLVDYWDEDRAMAELHSWRTIGDISVTGLPMTIRAMVIGTVRDGRRYGNWTRARQHPRSKQIRFARKQGRGREDGFTDTWAGVWRENSGIGPDIWLGTMARDGVLAESVREIKVRVPETFQIARVLDDMAAIELEMANARAGTGTMFPMTRSACDVPVRGACRYQCCCYAPKPDYMDPGESGVFRRRNQK